MMEEELAFNIQDLEFGAGVVLSETEVGMVIDVEGGETIDRPQAHSSCCLQLATCSAVHPPFPTALSCSTRDSR
jgi:hypothetical protein